MLIASAQQQTRSFAGLFDCDATNVDMRFYDSALPDSAAETTRTEITGTTFDSPTTIHIYLNWIRPDGTRGPDTGPGWQGLFISIDGATAVPTTFVDNDGALRNHLKYTIPAQASDVPAVFSWGEVGNLCTQPISLLESTTTTPGVFIDPQPTYAGVGTSGVFAQPAMPALPPQGVWQAYPPDPDNLEWLRVTGPGSVGDFSERHQYSRKQCIATGDDGIDRWWCANDKVFRMDDGSFSFHSNRGVDRFWALSNTDPNLMFGHNGNVYGAWNIATGAFTALYNHPSGLGQYSIGFNEGSPSNDDGSIALCAGGDSSNPTIVTINPKTGAVIGGPINFWTLFPTVNGSRMDWCEVTQDNGYLIASAVASPTRLLRCSIDLNPATATTMPTTYIAGTGLDNHSDSQLDASGNPIYVDIGYSDHDHLRVDTGQQTVMPIHNYGSSSNRHVSGKCRYVPELMLTSEYMLSSSFETRMFSYYAQPNQDTVAYWGHHFSIGVNTQDTPRATINATGTIVTFTTNMGASGSWYDFLMRRKP